MNVTYKLMQEHQLILKYIALLKKYLTKIPEIKDSKTLLESLENFVDFIQSYADKYHHAKEENILFRYMEEPGVLTHCNPLPVMMTDHEDGRRFTRGILAAVQEQNMEQALENAYGWMNVLESHISKEDQVLYAMAEEGLSDDQKNKILKEYEVVEKEMKSEELERKYQHLFLELELALKD